MKRLVGILVLVLISLSTIAQQDTKLTQNMFLVPFYNPGAMGQTDKICAAGAIRQQWAGFDGAPSVSIFNAHSSFSLLGRSHGVGVNFMSDNLALNEDLYANLGYSYKINLGGGVLGTGLTLGLANYTLDVGGFEGAEIIDVTGDDFIPSSEEGRFGFDMGFGLYYSIDKLYFGISSTHVNGPSIKSRNLEDPTKIKLARHYYAVGGYTLQLANPMFELMPSFLFQTDGKDNHIYLNTNLRYNKRFWGGVSYSVGGAASLLAGIELLNGIRVGYSYDIELSPLIKHSSGSHEITLRYCFDLSLDKSPQKYESIRFL